MRVPAEMLAVLVCPVAKAPLLYFPRGERDDDEAHGFLLSPAAKLRYRIELGVPVLLAEDATPVDAAELGRLQARAAELGL